MLKCGDIISLEHVNTERNMQGRTNKALISGLNEVSGASKGKTTDISENWVIECKNQGDNQNKEIINGNSVFYLKNEKTNEYLGTSPEYNYHRGNCGHRCPIMGQLEISSFSYQSHQTTWSLRHVTTLRLIYREF